MEIINNLPFRSETKLEHEVLKRDPSTNRHQIKKSISKRLHDRKFKQKPYYYHVFSHVTRSYQHDLLENPRSDIPNQDVPHYFHIFININTRFAVAHPLKSKSSQEIHESLDQFIQKYKPSKLTSDSEPAFTSSQNTKLLSDNNVQQFIVQDLAHNHSTLSIIDRLIKTLRDMNTPKPTSKHESTHPKFKSFSIPKMNKLIKIYNNSYHSAIKTEPEIMQNNPELESEYIFKQSERRLNQERISNFQLKPGAFVRYLLPTVKNHKKRFTTSFEAYKIDSRSGNLYNIIAQDGTTITLPRFRLILAHKSGKLPDNIKWAETIPDRWNGTIEKIISFNPKTNKYRVQFTTPNNESKPYIDEIPAVNLRGKYPQFISEIEKQFHKSRSTH